MLFEIVPDGDWNAHRLIKPVVGIDRLRRYTCKDSREPTEDSITTDEIEELDEFFEGAPSLDPPLDEDEEEPPPLAGIRPLRGGDAPGPLGPPGPPGPQSPPPPPEPPAADDGNPLEAAPGPPEPPPPDDVSMENPPEPDHEMSNVADADASVNSQHSDNLALEWDDMDFRDPGVDQIEEDLAHFHATGPAMLMEDADDPILREVIELERTLDQFDKNLALFDDHDTEIVSPLRRSSPEVRVEVPPSSPDTTPPAILPPERRSPLPLPAPDPVAPLPPPPDYPALTHVTQPVARKGPPRRPAPRAALPPPAVTRSRAPEQPSRLPVTVTLDAEATIKDRTPTTLAPQGPAPGTNAPLVPPPLSSQELRAHLLGPRTRNETKRAASRDVSFRADPPPFGKRAIIETSPLPTQSMGIAPGTIERGMGNAPAAETSSTKRSPLSTKSPRPIDYSRKSDSDSYSDEALDELAPLNSTRRSQREGREGDERRTRQQRRENLIESLRARNEEAAERHAIPSTQELLRARNQRRAREFLRIQNESDMTNNPSNATAVTDRSRSFLGARPKESQ